MVLIPGKTFIFSESFRETQTQQQNSDKYRMQWQGSNGELPGRPDRNKAAATAQKIWAAQRKSHTICCCYAKSFLQPTCKANATPQGQRPSVRMSQWERVMGGSSPRRETLPQLAESQRDEFRHNTEVQGGMQSWRKQWVERRREVVFFIHSKICPTSPPPSQVTVKHLENKGSWLFKSCLSVLATCTCDKAKIL